MPAELLADVAVRATISGANPVFTYRVPARLHAQNRGAPPPAPTAKASAPIDLTGYWVSVITEDWRYRMVTPAKGDYANIPVNADGRRVADTWDPTKDEAAGEQCRAQQDDDCPQRPALTHAGQVTDRWPVRATRWVSTHAARHKQPQRAVRIPGSGVSSIYPGTRDKSP